VFNRTAPPSTCPLRALKRVHSPPTTFPPFAQPVAERKCQARSSSTSRKCTGRKVASSTPYSSPRAVTSAAQKSSAAPDPTTAGNRRTTFEPHRSALPAIFLAWGSVLAAVGAGVPFFILLSARLPNLQRHHRLAQHQHGGSNRCLLTFGNQGSQETLLGDCVARVTG